MFIIPEDKRQASRAGAKRMTNAEIRMTNQIPNPKSQMIFLRGLCACLRALRTRCRSAVAASDDVIESYRMLRFQKQSVLVSPIQTSVPDEPSASNQRGGPRCPSGPPRELAALPRRFAIRFQRFGSSPLSQPTSRTAADAAECSRVQHAAHRFHKHLSSNAANCNEAQHDLAIGGRPLARTRTMAKSELSLQG
jgi:hypothetical protein